MRAVTATVAVRGCLGEFERMSESLLFGVRGANAASTTHARLTAQLINVFAITGMNHIVGRAAQGARGAYFRIVGDCTRLYSQKMPPECEPNTGAGAVYTYQESVARAL